MDEKIISNILYEIIERLVRFRKHLNDIENQFYNGSDDKKELIENYRNVLQELFEFSIKTYNEKCTDINIYKNILQLINDLHITYLSKLPRPIEPVELTRFERVISKQIIKLDNKEQTFRDNKENEVSILMNETIGETLDSDYLSEFKQKIKEILNLEIKRVEKKNKKLHVTIPRIDAPNTFRWPSLIHEMAHQSFLKAKFDVNIETDFIKATGIDKRKAFSGFFADNFAEAHFEQGSKLFCWLKECWCDLFACILIGPSLYFSQYLVFLNGESIYASNQGSTTDQSTHPNSLLRLYLINSIISHRFPRISSLISDFCTECEDVLENFMSESIELNKEIFNSFNLFFTSYFFSTESKISNNGNENLSTPLIELMHKYVNLQPEIIEQLCGNLSLGLPIPSIKILNNEKKYQEIPTYIQEIFLSSWITRFKLLMKNVLEIIGEEGSNLKKYEDIEKIILRHDLAVLKSIQVSEWFDYLTDEQDRSENIEIFNNSNIEYDINSFGGVLVDKEIQQLILKNEIKIIPLMYSGQMIRGKEITQISTTSIDVRLGTSFQVFFPDQYGLVDFTDKENFNFEKNSQRINLDFIEGITIAPGQFLLAHSMEYIKIPDYLSGNLEGRSSFARLGIEIHMTASYIDPGFEGVITFEIYNAGPSTVKLYPGMRIGQLRFERNNKPDQPYSKKHSVKYIGLLEHNLSKQNMDLEVDLIKKYKN